METSNEIGKLSKALKEFQKDVEPIGRDAKANYGRYATLGAILKNIKVPLAKSGLAFTQIVEGDNLTTMVMHDSGEWLRGTAALKLDKQTAQGQGSAITYARRYNLSAALGLDTDEDDDGQVAETPRQAAKTAPRSVEKPKPERDAMVVEKAQKERIVTLLKKLGRDTTTAKACSDAVFDITGMSLGVGNFDAIGDELAKELEAKNIK